MAEKITQGNVETYWRDAYKRMRVNMAEQLGNDVPNLDFVDSLTEKRAQEVVEIHERLQIKIDNSFPL